jgi:hypothetical protein
MKNLEMVTLDELLKDNLMHEMSGAMFSAIGTFFAIERGFLKTGEKNGLTGETLEEIAKDHEKELRELFDRYNQIFSK